MLIKSENIFFRFLIFGIFLCFLYGCAAPIAALRRVNEATLDQRFSVHDPDGPKNSERTIRTLRMYNLEHSQDESVRGLVKIYKKLNEEMTPDLLASYVEIAYCEAARHEKSDPGTAAEIYASVAIYSYFYLFDSKFDRERKFYDSQLRDVCLFYNGAVEKILSMMLDEKRNLYLEPGQEFYLKERNESWTFRVDLVSGNWDPDEIDYFKFSSDYTITGIENEYRQEGLGVPLIARRRSADSGKKEERYYPQGLCFPVSAFLRPCYGGAEKDPNEVDAVLELYDPLISPVTLVHGKEVPLETDLTTPLVYYMSDAKMHLMNSVGLFMPEKLLEINSSQSRAIKGLYMLQPYEPNKIPVVMVHGLWSSPMTWVEMFNTLRSIEEIRGKYQFWFYFYPSAQPFWVTAAQLRDDLAEIRNYLDPNHLEPTLDQMVLIGHSMGGLLSRMQVVSSGDHFWNLISDVPFDEAKMDPTTRDEIHKWFFFEPNPSVRRVITIATPFEGSEAANDLTKWFSHRLISLPEHYRSILKNLVKTEPDWVKNDRLLKVKTSVDSLTPDCPAFEALSKCYLSSSVALNNINGLLEEKDRKFMVPKGGDGVVSFKSSSQTGAESQKTISAEHILIHTHPAAILETKRILTEHLYQMEVESRARAAQIAEKQKKIKTF